MTGSQVLIASLLGLTLAFAGCVAETATKESRTSDPPVDHSSPALNQTPTNQTPANGTLPGETPVTHNRSLREGFEGGLDGWQTGRDLPEDPNNPGHEVQFTANRSSAEAATGNHSLRFRADGRQDDGTIWVYRAVNVTPGMSYSAVMRAKAWSAHQSDMNTIAHLVMYIGTSAPWDEGSFSGDSTGGGGAKDPTDDGDGEPGGSIGTFSKGGDSASLREPLNKAAGWRDYSLAWNSSGPVDGVVYIAIGITIVWEIRDVSYYVDDLEVDLVAQ